MYCSWIIAYFSIILLFLEIVAQFLLYSLWHPEWLQHSLISITSYHILRYFQFIYFSVVKLYFGIIFCFDFSRSISIDFAMMNVCIMRYVSLGKHFLSGGSFGMTSFYLILFPLFVSELAVGLILWWKFSISWLKFLML